MWDMQYMEPIQIESIAKKKEELSLKEINHKNEVIADNKDLRSPFGQV